MKTGRRSMITHSLFPCANRIILCAHYNMWPRVALAVSMLDAPMCHGAHIRADLLAFSVVPLHCPLAWLAGSRWGRAAAGGGSGTLPGTGLAALPHAPPGARRNRSLPSWPLLPPFLSRRRPFGSGQGTEHVRCFSTREFPCPSTFRAEGLTFEEILGSEIFSLFLNDGLFRSSAHSDFWICAFSRCS